MEATRHLYGELYVLRVGSRRGDGRFAFHSTKKFGQ